MRPTSSSRGAGTIPRETTGFTVEIVASHELAERAAVVIGDAMRAAVRDRGRSSIALSRGVTPPGIFDRLAEQDLEWAAVDVFQADERVAPEGDPERNLTLIERGLGDRVASDHLHAMPVTDDDLDAAALRYATELESVCGSPPVLDVVHLGLGPDGHTASLFPGDPVLGVTDRWVAATGPRDGRRRLTLTYPALDAARSLVFVVSGEEKAGALSGVARGDRSLPAARVRTERGVLLADEGAARTISAKR